MGILVGLLVVAIILYFLFGSSRKKKPSAAKPPSTPRGESIISANTPWMEERWALARKERDAGELKSVPQWFFDDVTERQMQKIQKMGLKISAGRPTKGEASDLIGLFEPAEDENIEILKFFKIPLKGMNQSKARYEVGKLLQDPERLEIWENRPASNMQKEFYRFFGIKIPQGLTHEMASKEIKDYKKKFDKENKQMMEEWESFEDIYYEINDPDFREGYDLKSISISLYRSAIEILKKEGKNLKEISDDIDILIDKIVEIKPEIQKL